MAEQTGSGRLFQRDRAQERKALAPVLVLTLGADKLELHSQAHGYRYGYGIWIWQWCGNGVRQFDSVHMVYGLKRGTYAGFFLFLLCQHGTLWKLGLFHHMLEQVELLVKILRVYREMQKRKKTRKRRW